MDRFLNCVRVFQRNFYYLSNNGGDMKSSFAKDVKFQNPSSQLAFNANEQFAASWISFYAQMPPTTHGRVTPYSQKPAHPSVCVRC
jgi:hypothetical protein